MAAEGFWQEDPLANVFLECAVPEACPGGGAVACNAEGGYSGYLCSECASGFYKLSDLCKPCPTGQSLWAIMIGVGVVLVGGGGYAATKKFDALTGAHVHMASILTTPGMSVSFLQLTSIFTSFDIEWPTTVTTVMGYASAVNFNLEGARLTAGGVGGGRWGGG